MKQLSKELFDKYVSNPLENDGLVRKSLGLREDRYYTVSVWPEHLAGRVYENRNVREVKVKKVSKSEQKT